MRLQKPWTVNVEECTHADWCMRTSQAHRSYWPGCSFSNKSRLSCREVIETEKKVTVDLDSSPYLPPGLFSLSLEAAVCKFQVPVCSRGQHGRAHLHVVFAGNEPRGVTGKSDQVPLPRHLWEQQNKRSRSQTKAPHSVAHFYTVRVQNKCQWSLNTLEIPPLFFF